MALATIARDTIPAQTRGGTSRLPADEQDFLRKIAANGELASDGKTYATRKDATRAAGPYRRFLRGLIRRGDVTGRVRSFTYPSGKKFAWAVEVIPADD